MTTTNTTPAPSFLDDAAPELVEILAHPEDDTPRLIYADWLEDHGDPERPELIRWMVAQGDVWARFGHRLTPNHYLICFSGHPLEGNPHREHYPGKSGSWACAMRVAMVGTAEIPDEPPFGIVEEFEVIFRRGFLAEVHAPLSVLEKHLPALVRQHPITRVRATDKEPRHYNGLTESYVWWRHLVVSHPQSRLPQNVWNAVREDGNPPGAYLDNGKRFLAADAAHAALSEAMLRLAKGVNFALES